MALDKAIGKVSVLASLWGRTQHYQLTGDDPRKRAYCTGQSLLWAHWHQAFAEAALSAIPSVFFILMTLEIALKLSQVSPPLECLPSSWGLSGPPIPAAGRLS